MNLVPGARLELAQCYHRRILNPLRLPIPPSRQDVVEAHYRDVLYICRNKFATHVKILPCN